MSLPLLDDEFNFNDINLDFLESPSRPTRVDESAAKVQHRKMLSPTKLFTNEKQENNSTQPQLQNSIPRHSIVELSKRVAEVDTLVCQIRKTENERDNFRKQLEEFRQSANEVQSLYAHEKQKRMEEKAKHEDLMRRFQSLDTNLSAKTLEVDQLQAQLDGLKGPIEYNELAVRYLRLVQKLEDQLHWHETSIVKDLQKYCKDKCLKIPPIIQRSPRKRKASAVKIDAEIQCNIEVNTVAEKREMRDHYTQYDKIAMRNQGCQHIGTTTTRSTTTACFFKYHDVGVSCNLLDFNYALNEMLHDMCSWSTHAAPLSPIADLDTKRDELISADVSTIPLSSVSSNCTNEKISLPPPPDPLPLIELKTAGTCTFLCNVQRHIDYVPSIKRSNSRPPSRVMLETVKDENTTQSTSTTPSVLNPLNNQVPSIPSHIFPSAFDELWQIFGHMLYGLLQRRAGNGAPFSNQTITPGSITNQQEFYNWLQTLYFDFNSDERTQEIRNSGTRGVRIERSSTVDNNREGSITTENLSDHNARNRNVASPLNFSNAAPVNSNTSAQYLFKPKAQRNSNNNATDEVPPTDCSERHSIGTSPIRCLISSPICSEMNVIKENSFENSTNKSMDDSNVCSVENRTPSAFISAKSATTKDTSKTETDGKVLPTVRNRNKTLEPLEKQLHKSWKNSRKKRLERQKNKRLSKSLLNTEIETAVDFISKLNTFQNKQIDEISDSNESQVDFIEAPKDQSEKGNKALNRIKITTLNDKKHEIQIRELFGSDTDSNDDEIKSNLPLSLENVKENNEEIQEDKGFHINYFSNPSIDDSIELNQFNSTRKADYRSDNEEQTIKTDKVIECSAKTESNYQNKSNTPNTKKNQSYDGDHKMVFVEKIKQNIYEEEKRNEDSRNEQDMIQYNPMSSVNLISIPNDSISNENSLNVPLISSKIERGHTELLNPDTKNCPIKKQPSEKQFYLLPNEIQQPKSPDEDCISPIIFTHEEIKQHDFFDSPKETSSQIVRSISPISDASTSSIESKLVIVSDNEDMKDLQSMPLIPKRRGRKRKSESSSPSPTNLIETNIIPTPCKRSARLLAKRIVREEQKTMHQNLSLLTLGKYTRRNNQDTFESKKESINIKEEHVSKSECPKVPVHTLGYFQEYNNEENAEVHNTHELSNETSEIIEDDDLTNNNPNKNTIIAFTEETIQRITSPTTSHFTSSPPKCVHVSETHILSLFSLSPASPTPLDNVSINDQPIKNIPLQRPGENFVKRRNKTLLYHLIRNYGTYQYRPHDSKQLTEHEKADSCKLVSYFNEYLTAKVQSEDAAVQLVNVVLDTSQHLKVIGHALCTSIQEEARPPTTPYENLKNAEVPLLNRSTPNNIHQKMEHIVRQLTQRHPELPTTLLIIIESILFSVQNADNLSVNAALNLTDLYLLTLLIQIPPLSENPARLFIAKCLYYHKVKAIPMIYAVLCAFPTTLPHREERNYDRSDALITVIQHALMCTTYDMDNHELFHREILSKLRFVYRFEVYKPDFQHVLENLLEKLRAGRLNNLKYAFAIFCKRLQPDRVVRDIIQPHLIPLSNEYYSVLQQTTEYDERAAALLDCFSCLVKPFPRDTISHITAEINNYLSIFKRFLSVVERPIVQEAAVCAILRLQRFSYINCYNALASFRPDYDLQPLTRAALQTFIHRKPLNFLKSLLNQSG